MSAPAIVWFRHDLRLADNPALSAAAASGAPIVALFILDDHAAGDWRPGGASKWWLHHSLSAMMKDLSKLGAPLYLRRGSAEVILPGVVAETGAGSIYWNRIYEPWAVRRDAAIKSSLRAQGLRIESFNASLLFEPSEILNSEGVAFRVFTPFWRACLAAGAPAAPLKRPPRLKAGPTINAERLDDWRLLPTKPDWAEGLREAWTPGEGEAQRKLEAFAHGALRDYRDARDFPGKEGVSRLSPHLRWGEIGPRQIWSAVSSHGGADGAAYVRQIGWREFSHHLLFANPDLPDRPVDKRFERFPWTNDDEAFADWSKGKTGYPMVDAGMRQLWRTGYMHNRARLVAGSFLVKDLLLPWRSGERWFWDTLVDADLGNNSASWQWVAGCGVDAAPYFRVFNPVLQGEKFDPEGDYIRRYVPEIARLDSRFIHRPWEAPEAALREAGVRLGETYPRPIVDHKKARVRALEAFASIKSD
jgi:deoxyribodipyrimidine photo-lyase